MVIKLVSIKLQRKSNDIVKAYNMIVEMEKELRHMINNADTYLRHDIALAWVMVK